MRENEMLKEVRIHSDSGTLAEASACSTDPSSGACCCAEPASFTPTHEHQHDHGIEYLPMIASLLLLLSGIALSYYGITWFDGLTKFVWFAAAYLPVGGKVLLQAAHNISKGDVF